MPDFLDRLGAELARAASNPPATSGRRSWYRRRGTALVAVCALLGGGGVAVGLIGRASPGHVPPHPSAPEATAIDSAATSAFSILRRAQGNADAIPTNIPVAFSGASGANLALARRAPLSDGSDVWIVPGRGSICILAREPARGLGGASCQTDKAATEGQLYTASGSRSSNSEFLTGLAPDGVQTVTVIGRDGSKMSVPTSEGVYSTTLQGVAGAVEFDDAAGHVVVKGVAVR
jgi:hypothetical protein